MTDSSSIYDTFTNLVGGGSSRAPNMSSSTYKKLDYAGESGTSSIGRGGEAWQRRNYDMCMVFRYKTSKYVKFPLDPNEDNSHLLNEDMAGGRQLVDADKSANDRMRMWKQRRESILKTLQNTGLHLYCFFNRDRDEVICKIGCSADKLRDTAARMKYKLPLKPEYLSAYAEYRHDFPGRPELQFTDRRVVSHIYKVHTADDSFPTDDAIFSTVDKVLIIHHTINSTDKDCAGINVGNLLHSDSSEDSTLISYFPLHEETLLKELTNAKLYKWVLMDAEWTGKVRDYYGDKIAFYFVWLAFYWKWLLLISVVGLAKQINDLVCRSPDNWSALPFCVLMAVWATFLPHFWRRQETNVALTWGTLEQIETLERCRPEHWGEPRLNPVTAQVEPYYPFGKRLLKYCLSVTVMMMAGVMVIIVILGLLLARHHHKGDVAGGVVAFQFYLAAVVEAMNLFLSFLARKLTYLENHRTRSQHETHQLAKVMIFKFVNSYFALYYITFFKHHAPKWFGTGLKCVRDDCMLDLQYQLAVFVVFRLVIQNTFELLAPRLALLYRSWYFEGKNIFSERRVELADMSSAEKQAKKDTYNSFDDFDEALISHGYCTLFAVAAPWVCAATLFGVFLEVYIDKRSLLETKQRSMPIKCRNNEPWSTAFTLYGIVAAFTNVFLLIFAAEHAAFAQMTITEKLVLFVFIEKFILLANVFLNAIFPQVPRSATMLQLKQATVVHRCLENIKVEPSQDFTMFRDNTRNEYEIFEHDYMEDEDMEEPELSLSAFSQMKGVMYDAVLDERKKAGELALAPFKALQV